MHENTLILKNALIFTPHEEITDSIIIENGKISVIGEKKTTESAKTIDLSGKIITPSLIDLHTHGACGTDFLSPRNWDALEKYYISHGTTSYLATLMSSSHEYILNAIKLILKYFKQYSSTNCIGIHLEGLFLNPDFRGIHPLEFLSPLSLEKIQEYIKAGEGHIKIITLSPELDLNHDIIQEIIRQGIIVAGGHSGASYETAKRAFDQGMNYTVHTGNAMAAFHHRNPGILGAALEDDRIFCEVIADGIHLHPAALKLFYKLKGADKTVLSTDSAPLAGLPDGEYSWQDQKLKIYENRITTSDGKLAGSSLDMLQAVKNMVKWSGCSFSQSLQMATTNPANILGLKTGQIKAGYDADLLIFDPDLKINMVIKKGKIVWS